MPAALQYFPFINDIYGNTASQLSTLPLTVRINNPCCFISLLITQEQMDNIYLYYQSMPFLLLYKSHASGMGEHMQGVQGQILKLEAAMHVDGN